MMNWTADAIRPAVLVITIAAAFGCGSAYSYLRLSPAERRLFDAYGPFMTMAQQAEYLKLATREEREAYVGRVGVRQRFLSLSEDERAAVMDQRLVKGMSADALLMAWGVPWKRLGLGEDVEEWVYWPDLSRHLSPSEGYRIYMVGGRVSEWARFPIEVPERGRTQLRVKRPALAVNRLGGTRF